MHHNMKPNSRKFSCNLIPISFTDSFIVSQNTASCQTFIWFTFLSRRSDPESNSTPKLSSDPTCQSQSINVVGCTNTYLLPVFWLVLQNWPTMAVNLTPAVESVGHLVSEQYASPSFDDGSISEAGPMSQVGAAGLQLARHQQGRRARRGLLSVTEWLAAASAREWTANVDGGQPDALVRGQKSWGGSPWELRPMHCNGAAQMPTWQYLTAEVGLPGG